MIDRTDSLPISTLTALQSTDRLEHDVTGLFDQWRNSLLGYIITLGLPLHDSEEIVQEVFLSLFQHLRRGRPRDNLRGWIFRVGHNLSMKRRSAAIRQPLYPVDDNSLHAVKDDSPNPEQAFAMKQRQARLLAVVAALPEQDRWCLHLRSEGLRYREIAEVLGISLGSVAISLARAIERLQRVDQG